MALKEGIASSLLGVPVVKLEAPEKTLVMDVEEVFLGDSKEKALTSASVSGFSSSTFLLCPAYIDSFSLFGGFTNI